MTSLHDLLYPSRWVEEGGLPHWDAQELQDAVRAVRARRYDGIRFSCYSCDEAQAAHRLVPADVPLCTPHWTWGGCKCIVGNS